MRLIELTKGKCAQVDDTDFDGLSPWSWCAKKSPYTYYGARGAIINGKSIEIKMHRQIMGLSPGDGKVVDHIDGNGLNNQRINLRVCSRGQNTMNARKRKNGTSKFKGVSYQAAGRGKKRWVSQIHLNRKHFHLGRYLTEPEAAKAYDKKAIELYGEFAVLNFKLDQSTLQTP